jgi:hypothetical protein
MRRRHGCAAQVAVPARDGGQHTSAGTHARRLRPVPSRGRHCDHPRPVGAVPRLDPLGADGRYRNHAGQLSRQHVAVLIHRPRPGIGHIVRAAQVLAGVGQIHPFVTGGGDAQDTMGGGVLDRAPDGFVCHRLTRYVGAGQQPWIQRVAAVGDPHLLPGGPHEAAHGVLRVDEPVFVDHLHRSQPDPGRHPDDAAPVVGRGDRAGHVRAVRRRARTPRAARLVRLARQATR